MFRYIAVLAILPALIMGEIAFEACRDGGHLPNWVAINDCDTSGCRIVRNEPLHVTGEIFSLTHSEALYVQMNAFILGIEMPLELEPEVADGCQVVPTGCPVTAGQTVRIETTTVVEVPDLAVGLSLPVELSVTNENSERVMCVRTTVTIV